MPKAPRSPEPLTFRWAHGLDRSLCPFITRTFPVFFSVKKILLVPLTQAMSTGKDRPPLYVCSFVPLGSASETPPGNSTRSATVTAASLRIEYLLRVEGDYGRAPPISSPRRPARAAEG